MAKVKEDTIEFITVNPVKHDGEDYQVGEIIALTEKDSTALLELGVIKEVGVESASNEAQQESEAV